MPKNVRVLDPEEEIFIAMKKTLEKKHSTYDGFLPPKGTPYPFIYLGEFTQQDDASNKSLIFAEVNATIHVWHDNPRQRGTVSAMLADIKEAARGLIETKHYTWKVSSVYQRILEDNTTNTPLMHGVVEITFKQTGGK